MRSPRRKRSGSSPRSAGISRAGARAKLLAALGATVAAMLLLAASASAAVPTQLTCAEIGAPGSECFVGSETPAGSMEATWLSVDEATGDVYVIDKAHDAVDVFTSSGAYVRQLKGSETTAGSFAFGGDDDVAVDNSCEMQEPPLSGSACESFDPNHGNVYVNSENSGHVFAFDSSGAFLWQSSAGISDVCGVSVDPSGHPWLGDFSNGLQQLSPSDGSTVGSPITVTPKNVNVGPSVCHHAWEPNGNVVVGHWRSSIESFDLGGIAIREYPSNEVFNDVAVDWFSGDVYADAWASSSTQSAWDPSGNGLYGGSFGPEGNGVTVDALRRRAYFSTASGVEAWSIPNPPHKLEVEITPEGSGTVNCDGEECEAEYDEGEPVELEAVPGESYEFIGWSGGGCAGSEPTCTVELVEDTVVTAEFRLIEYELGVAKAGSGSGQVSSAPAGILCGETCSALFPKGEFLSLTATADPGSQFAGWSGACTNAAGACTIAELTGDAAVTATFNLVHHEEGGGGNGGGNNGGGGNTGGGVTGGEPAVPPIAEKPAPKPTYGQCVKSANRGYKKALKAAKKRHGKARAKAIKAAQKKKGKAVVKCKKQFGKPLPKHHHKRHRR